MKNNKLFKKKYIISIIFSIISIFIIAALITNNILPAGECACEPGGPEPLPADYLYSTVIVALFWLVYLLSKRK